jgi:hypothetical protein
VSGRGFSIDTAEWRALCVESIQRLANFVSQNAVLSPEGLKAMHTHLDRSKTIAAAWSAAGLPVANNRPAPAAAPSAPFTVSATGVPAPVVSGPAGEPVKKRGGWPKGKSRKNPRAAS